MTTKETEHDKKKEDEKTMKKQNVVDGKNITESIYLHSDEWLMVRKDWLENFKRPRYDKLTVFEFIKKIEGENK